MQQVSYRSTLFELYLQKEFMTKFAHKHATCKTGFQPSFQWSQLVSEHQSH